MLGERCDQVTFDSRGVEGDRLFAIRTRQGKFASGKSTRRFERVDGLFTYQAGYDGAVPVIQLPSGTEVRGDDPRVDDLLSASLGQAVSLVREATVSHFDAGAVHLLTTGSLAWLQMREPTSRIDARRFRPNIVLAVDHVGLIEDQWLERRVRLGKIVMLEVEERTERCAMPTFVQRDLSEAPALLRSLVEGNEGYFGVYAHVIEGGPVSLGDRAYLL